MRLKHVADMVPHEPWTPMRQHLTVIINHMAHGWVWCDVNHVRPKIPALLPLMSQNGLTNEPLFILIQPFSLGDAKGMGWVTHNVFIFLL